jgi:hypothetical protein
VSSVMTSGAARGATLAAGTAGLAVGAALAASVALAVGAASGADVALGAGVELAAPRAVAGLALAIAPAMRVAPGLGATGIALLTVGGGGPAIAIAATRHKHGSNRIIDPFHHGLPMESNRAAVSASLDARERATCTRAFWYCCPAVNVA